MSRRSWILAAAFVITLLVAVAMTGWQTLVDYIDPNDAQDRKDAVQVYAVIVAGVIASITAAVGLLNLRLTRRNLEQQRELEAQRAQGTALQAYYEQIGKLITDGDLLNTQRKEIRELARGQTLTVLQEVDAKGKGSLLTFLHGAGLIGSETPAISLVRADLVGADLRGADLWGAHLREADLRGADLRGAGLLFGADLRGADLRGADLREAGLQNATLQDSALVGADLRGANLQRSDLREVTLVGADLRGTDLREADLRGADLQGADLQGANLQGAKVSDKQLAGASSLQGVTMPDGSKHT